MRVQSVLDETTEQVVRECIGCAVAVHRTLGPGYLESVYRRSMKLELRERAMTVDEERAVDVIYRGSVVGRQRIDLVVQGLVVVEVKAVERLHDVHVSQVVSYLHGLSLRAGLLINFREALVKHGIRRIVR